MPNILIPSAIVIRRKGIAWTESCVGWSEAKEIIFHRLAREARLAPSGLHQEQKAPAWDRILRGVERSDRK